MTFKDRFPLEIDFEIDRQRLLRYLLAQAKIGCFGLPFPFAMLLALAFFNEGMAPYHNTDVWFSLGWFSFYMMAGLLACGIFGSILYFAYFRPSARLKADNLRLMVDGPYLRLVSGGLILNDQRFHFRDVSCYSTVQGPLLRRHGLKSLCFRVNGHAAAPPLSVIGLVDAGRVRDVLCEIDASREWSDSSIPGSLATDADG